MLRSGRESKPTLPDFVNSFPTAVYISYCLFQTYVYMSIKYQTAVGLVLPLLYSINLYGVTHTFTCCQHNNFDNSPFCHRVIALFPALPTHKYPIYAVSLVIQSKITTANTIYVHLFLTRRAHMHGMPHKEKCQKKTRTDTKRQNLIR